MRAIRRRLAATLGLALGAWLMLVSTALGADGIGTYGPADDKVITYFAFGVMVFFALLVIGLSLLQMRLDSRKERRKQDLERLGR